MSNNYSAYSYGRWIKWIVLGLVAFILIISLVGSYNGLISVEQKTEQMWSNVENTMQRRADVIVNLAAVVEEAEKHEEKVFGAIAAARTDAQAAQAILNDETKDVKSKLEANAKLNDVIKSISIVVEAYPELKSNEQFSNLQSAIEGSENRVYIARKDYIEAVQEYNLKIKKIPGSIFAAMMGFEKKDYFEADSAAQKAPDLNKMFND